MVADTWNPSLQETKAGGSQLQGHRRAWETLSKNTCAASAPPVWVFITISVSNLHLYWRTTYKINKFMVYFVWESSESNPGLCACVATELYSQPKSSTVKK